MAKTKSPKKRSVAIGTWPTPEKVIGMPTKKGKVSKLRGKYFLTVGRKKMEIAGTIVTDGQIRKLVGKEVHAVVSGSSVVAIGVLPKIIQRRPISCYWIICYIPAPDILRKIGPEIRKKLISEMVGQHIITTKLARELRRGL